MEREWLLVRFSIISRPTAMPDCGCPPREGANVASFAKGMKAGLPEKCPAPSECAGTRLWAYSGLHLDAHAFGMNRAVNTVDTLQHQLVSFRSLVHGGTTENILMIEELDTGVRYSVLVLRKAF